MTRILLVLALVAGGACKKQEAAPQDKPPDVHAMLEPEIKRGTDACRAYLDAVCACAEKVPAEKVPAVAKQCELARALPDALRISLEVAASPDSKPDIAQQSYASARKTVAECIEQTAKLPSLGCP